MHSAIIPMAPKFSLKKILVATDLSSASTSLLTIAAPLARRLGSEVILVHVLSNASVAPENTVFSPEMSEESAKQKIAELLHGPCGDDLSIRSGDAATHIADLARTEGIDLVITGTHGRRGFRHFLIGSGYRGLPDSCLRYVAADGCGPHLGLPLTHEDPLERARDAQRGTVDDHGRRKRVHRGRYEVRGSATAAAPGRAACS